MARCALLVPHSCSNWTPPLIKRHNKGREGLKNRALWPRGAQIEVSRYIMQGRAQEFERGRNLKPYVFEAVISQVKRQKKKKQKVNTSADV